MKNDILKVSTMSKSGKFSSHIQKGAGYMTTTDASGKDSQIAIQVSHTTGVGPFKKSIVHENALINITFDDGRVWSGNFDKLKNLLIG